VAFPSQRRAQGTKAAGHIWSAALFALFVCATWPGLAFAKLMIETGVNVSEKTKPYVGLRCDADSRFHDWTSTLAIDAKIEPQRTIGDASAKIEWHAETTTPLFTLIELDGFHDYVREADSSIEQYHDLGFDAGTKRDFGDWSLKADVGIFGRLHQDTLRPGFSALDRRKEDFTESDLALRATFLESRSVHPFVEVASLRRDYMIDTGRDFSGADFIFGLEFANSRFKGEAGVFLGARDRNGASAVTVIGPTLDLKWFPRQGTEVGLDVTTGLEQETTGIADIYAFYEAEFSIKQSLGEALWLSALISSSLEKHRDSEEFEFEPGVKIEWAVSETLRVFGIAGVSYLAIEDADSSWSPTTTIGVKWSL
jgi:Putative beta-barrel porin 2